MATVKLKEIATDITWGDATRDINENNRKIQVALATVSAAGEGNAAWGESTTESAELIIGGSGTKVVSLDGHTHETSEVNGLDAKLSQTDASIDSLKSSDTAIKGQISGVNASISDLYNKVQDVDEGGVKKTDLKTLTVNVNGTKVGEYDTKADKTINITADMLGLSGAMTFVGVTITAISQGSTDNQVDMEDGASLAAKKGDVVIYGNKEFVWVGSKWQELGDEQSFALKSVTVTGTGYLTGGGTLESNRTIDIATSVKTKIDNGDAALTKANALETNLANNYPTKNGTGASGTWGVDISGKAASADKVANALTFNSSGAGAASESTYDGSAAKTISYNTIGAAKAVHSHAFSDITGKPTTLDGYGITDGASDAELSAHANNTNIHLAVGDRENIEAALVMASDASSELAAVLEGYETTPVLKTELGKKQDKLVSGTSIKTVNGESLLGDGNIFIPKVFIDDATDESVAIHSQESDILSSVVFVSPTTHTHSEYTKRSEIVNSLSSTDGTVPLSANQGRVLNEKFADVVTQADVVNSLGSTEQKKPLSAFMGKVLSDRLTNGDFIAKEAKMKWGGSNNKESDFSPIESLLTESANRLTFGNAGGVTVEYSTNGGSTWNAYTEETDYGKLLHPIYSGTFCLGGSKATDRATTLNDMLRITINAKGIGRYLGGIRKMLIYGSTRNASSLNVVLEKRTAISGVAGGGDNAFVQAGTLTFEGWPAWGAISLEDNYFGTWLNSETYNNGSVIEYRLTFSINKVSYTTYGAPFIQLVKLHSLTVYEANEFISRYGSSVLLMSDGMIHSDREFYLTKRVQAQNMQVSNLNVLSSLNITPSTTIQGVLTVGSKISASGNIEGSAKLTVEGDATLKSNATVSGDLTVNGTLNYTMARVETSEASVTLDASKYTVINCVGDLTINLPSGYATDGKEYVCEIRTDQNTVYVDFPSDIKFSEGNNYVDGFSPNSVYRVTIQYALATIIYFA